MNQRAQELNMKNTNFVTPNGLDDENHYSTAYDMAILTNYALKNEKFKEIVGTKRRMLLGKEDIEQYLIQMNFWEIIQEYMD